MKNHFRQNSLVIIPSLISLFLVLVILTSRLSLSIKSISLITSLILILLVVPLKDILKTYYHHPIARAAILFYGCLIIGTFYSDAPLLDRLNVLKNYLPLLWIGLVITFFQTTFSLSSHPLIKQLTENKTQAYISIFIYGAVLVAFLGCLNAWNIVDVVGLIHSHPITDPPEYPFGTFSFSISFAAYLSMQKMRYTPESKSYYYFGCFLFLTFFIFFISHQRTAYILYGLLLLLYGYQKLRLKGFVCAALLLIFLNIIAFKVSSTFQARTIAAVHDVQIYKKGDPISSTGLRLAFLESSYHLWQKKPWFGYGTGAFRKSYLTLDGYNTDGKKNTREHALDQPHSDYAYIAVQLGIFGLMTFLWLLLTQFFVAFRLPVFEKQCAHALILGFMVVALDTTLLFYATSATDYFFFSALFYAPLKKK